jgi:hypothetical protein
MKWKANIDIAAMGGAIATDNPYLSDVSVEEADELAAFKAVVKIVLAHAVVDHNSVPLILDAVSVTQVED